MLTAAEVNEIIRTSRKRTLRFDEAIVGQVIIPAGTYAKTFVFTQIFGGLVVGGFNLPGARHGLVRATDHKILNRGNPDLVEFGGGWLLPHVKGPQPIAHDLKITANINALGGGAAFFGTAIYSSRLSLHVANAKVQGVLLDKCDSVRLTGSAANIGVPKTTGQGYACQIKAGSLCRVVDWHVQGARSAVQLSHGGWINSVEGLSGELWPGGVWADIHGGNEISPYFDVEEVKTGNEAWTGEAVDVRLGPKVKTIIRIEERPGVTLGVPVQSQISSL